MLLDLVGGMGEDYQRTGGGGAAMEDIKANLAETWFAWSGPTTKRDLKRITEFRAGLGDRVRRLCRLEAIRPCTSIRGTEIPRTTTGRSQWGAEYAFNMIRMRASALLALSWPAAQAGTGWTSGLQAT